MNFDLIDSGEELLGSPHDFRIDILGHAAVDQSTGELIDWRTAVPRNRFFQEVTDDAWREGELRGEMFGALFTLLRCLGAIGSDNNNEARDILHTRIRHAALLFNLFERSPVPSSSDLSDLCVGAESMNVDSDETDDGSAAQHLLCRCLLTPLLKDVKRGGLLHELFTQAARSNNSLQEKVTVCQSYLHNITKGAKTVADW